VRHPAVHDTPRARAASPHGPWRAAFDATVPVEGAFEAVPLHRVLCRLHAHRLDGVLHVSSGRRRKSLFAVGGTPVYATSNLASETLGALLVRSGKIRAEEQEATWREARAGGRLHGQLLVERGRLTHKELEIALHWQASVKMLDVFGWLDGHYRFDGDEDARHVFRLQLSLGELLVRGIKTHLMGHEAEARLKPHLDHALQHDGASPFDLTSLHLSKAELRLLAAIDEAPRTLRDLYPLSTVPRGATSQLLYAVTELGLYRFVDPEVRRAAEELSPEALATRLKRLEGANHFDVLKVHAIAMSPEVESAYEHERACYDPARLPPEAPETSRQALAAIRRRLDEAHAALRERDPRVRYRRDVVPQERLRLFADLQFRKGEVAMFWKGQPDVALPLFACAAELQPDDGVYLAHLGLATLRRGGPGAASEGLRLIEHGIQLGPRMGRTYMCMGLALRDRGDQAGAARMLQRAMQCDDDPEDMRRFLKTLRGAGATGGAGETGGDGDGGMPP
jgi:tetratricopeptide (TPR) repeat protein